MTRRGLIVGGLAALLLGACSNLDALRTINDLTPGDGGATKIVDGAAFGPDPMQTLDVWVPKNAKNARVLVFWYGGSWRFGNREDYGFVAKAFVAKGYVVVLPDYRKSPPHPFPGFVQDGAAAVAWTVANIAKYGGDPARIGVSGHSAGAHIAAMVTLDPQWLAQAGTPGAVKAFVGFAGPYDFYPFDPGGSAEKAFGRPADPAATQPITFARADAPPSLLLTGDADDVVKPRNSAALAAALSAKGARVETRVYPGVGHVGLVLALSKPFRGKATALTDATAFLDRTL